MEEKSIRYGWVDVSKGIAMLFVYLGHCHTQFVTSFAYAFHLQLFFLAAGFFAVKSSKRGVKQFVERQLCQILLPYFLWVVISFIIKNLDNTEISFANIFLQPSSMQANYWFFPAFLAVTTIYYFLYKLLKKPGIILGIAFLLHIIWGETPLAAAQYNPFSLVASLPGLSIINSWFAISAIPQYLFWYSLGAISFHSISVYVESRNTNPRFFLDTGGGV